MAKCTGGHRHLTGLYSRILNGLINTMSEQKMTTCQCMVLGEATRRKRTIYHSPGCCENNWLYWPKTSLPMFLQLLFQAPRWLFTIYWTSILGLWQKTGLLEDQKSNKSLTICCQLNAAHVYPLDAGVDGISRCGLQNPEWRHCTVH